MLSIKQKLSKIYLPKWPGLLVKGDSVTEKQALDIIYKTNDWGMYKYNNLHQLTSIAEFIVESTKIYDKALKLSYMHTDRLFSSWIGGLKGFVNFDGTIFTNNSNIGKYPSTEEVYKDLVKIAKAFPYLTMNVWLLNHEICEDEFEPVIQYKINNSNVDVLIEDEINIQAALDTFNATDKPKIEDQINELFNKKNDDRLIKLFEHYDNILKIFNLKPASIHHPAIKINISNNILEQDLKDLYEDLRYILKDSIKTKDLEDETIDKIIAQYICSPDLLNKFPELNLTKLLSRNNFLVKKGFIVNKNIFIDLRTAIFLSMYNRTLVEIPFEKDETYKASILLNNKKYINIEFNKEKD